jgi:hypothetical protein
VPVHVSLRRVVRCLLHHTSFLSFAAIAAPSMG